MWEGLSGIAPKRGKWRRRQQQQLHYPRKQCFYVDWFILMHRIEDFLRLPYSQHGRSPRVLSSLFRNTMRLQKPTTHVRTLPCHAYIMSLCLSQQCLCVHLCVVLLSLTPHRLVNNKSCTDTGWVKIFVKTTVLIKGVDAG